MNIPRYLMIITLITHNTTYNAGWFGEFLNTGYEMFYNTGMEINRMRGLQPIQEKKSGDIVTRNNVEGTQDLLAQQNVDNLSTTNNLSQVGIEKETIPNADRGNINLVVNVNNSANANNQNNVSQQAMLQATQVAYQKMISYMQSINMNTIKNHIEHYGQQGMDFFWYYKYRIICGLIASTYLSIAYNLIYLYAFLSNTAYWANWKHEFTLEQLYTIPQKELQNELLRDIQSRYMSTQNPTDCISPLVSFVRAIEQEAHCINRYITLIMWLHRLHVLSVFPTNITKITFIQDQSKRLSFVQHIFVSWSADYNLSQVTRKAKQITTPINEDLEQACEYIKKLMETENTASHVCNTQQG